MISFQAFLSSSVNAVVIGKDQVHLGLLLGGIQEVSASALVFINVSSNIYQSIPCDSGIVPYYVCFCEKFQLDESLPTFINFVVNAYCPFLIQITGGWCDMHGNASNIPLELGANPIWYNPPFIIKLMECVINGKFDEAKLLVEKAVLFFPNGGIVGVTNEVANLFQLNITPDEFVATVCDIVNDNFNHVISYHVVPQRERMIGEHAAEVVDKNEISRYQHELEEKKLELVDDVMQDAIPTVPAPVPVAAAPVPAAAVPAQFDADALQAQFEVDALVAQLEDDAFQAQLETDADELPVGA